MKSKRLCRVATALLLVAFLVSVALNVSFFSRGRQYYLQLNTTRLDPLGLNHYSTLSDQRHLTDSTRPIVVFYGDSRAASWPSPDLSQFEFINRGIGSQTSAQVAQRYDYHVKPLMPDVIVVQVGINNLKTISLFPEQREMIVASCEKDIEQIVERSIESGATVILTTVFPLGEVPIERRPFWSKEVAVAIDEVNTHIHSLAGENVIVFDAFSILADDRGVVRPEYSRDLLHLKLAGYEVLNEELSPLLESLE